MKKKGTLIVLSGFSGVGKNTVLNQVLAQRPDIHYSVSFTTRSPREGEVNGVHYNFVTREDFQARIERGEFLEHAEYNGNFYGTSMKVIRDNLDQGVDVILEIEVKGAAAVMEKMPEAVSVFLVPPSFEELERRLRLRGTDSEEVIRKRMEISRIEAKEVKNYEYIIVNETVDHAVEEFFAILTAVGCRRERRIHLIEGV